MIDFSEISTEQILARGQYSIVRIAREAALKTLRDACELQNNKALAVLREVQEAAETEHIFVFMHANLARMAETVTEIEELTRQLDLIRPLAFPK